MVVANPHKHAYVTEAVYYYAAHRKIKKRCACGAKTFAWQRQLEGGAWIAKRGGDDPGLYGEGKYRDDADATILYVVEGEKDTDSIALLGGVAFSPPDGAGSWRDGYSSYLHSTFPGASVIVVCDDDEAGRRHASAVHDSLRAGGFTDVAVVEPPVGGDASGYLEAGHGLDNLRSLVDSGLSSHRPTSFSSGLGAAFAGCQIREDDPSVFRGYQGPSSWVSLPEGVTGHDVTVQPGDKVDPFAVRVRCGGCKAYLQASLDGGKTRICWRCRVAVEHEDGVSWKPYTYRCKEQA